jgi:2-keto-4-pentenoate hydratase/2-oxohepta-3-ene-1,7-dioic acid hydratase in catechol pathway
LGPQPWKFELHKNGSPVQLGNTADMIHGIDEIISHVSHYFTLKKGDLIFTGTPSGVGPVAPGDKLEGTLCGRPCFYTDIL